MKKNKVLITRKWPESVEKKLQSLFDVTLNIDDKPLTQQALRNALGNYDAVCPAVCDSLPASVFPDSNQRCKIIANFGVGFNHINLPAAQQSGITVTNTPGVLTESTADLAMTLLLMSARRAAEGDRLVRSGDWQGWSPSHMMSSDVSGATLGLIGFGRIAQAMARKAHLGFGMKILYFKPSPADQNVVKKLQAIQCPTIEDLIKESDFVSLHCPGNKNTYHLINEQNLKLMKPGAHLINTSRGDVVDTQALTNVLQNKQIAGAGLDVYEGEPNVDPALIALENVVLLPHLGSATLSTRTAMGEKALKNLVAFFNKHPIPDKVI